MISRLGKAWPWRVQCHVLEISFPRRFITSLGVALGLTLTSASLAQQTDEEKKALEEIEKKAAAEKKKALEKIRKKAEEDRKKAEAKEKADLAKKKKDEEAAAKKAEREKKKEEERQKKEANPRRSRPLPLRLRPPSRRHRHLHRLRRPRCGPPRRRWRVWARRAGPGSASCNPVRPGPMLVPRVRAVSRFPA